VLLGLGALLAGCGYTQGWRVPTGPSRATHRGRVAIYRMGDALPSRFLELGLVQVQGSGTHADLEHVYEGLTEQARTLGADAVVRVEVTTGSTQAWGAGVAVRTGEGPPAPSDRAPDGDDPNAPAAPGAPRAPWAPR
jgi:hypothetical protein